jgi:hypothetical protein
MVEAIESLGAGPAPMPERLPLFVYPLRLLLLPVALLLALTAGSRA